MTASVFIPVNPKWFNWASCLISRVRSFLPSLAAKMAPLESLYFGLRISEVFVWLPAPGNTPSSKLPGKLRFELSLLGFALHRAQGWHCPRHHKDPCPEPGGQKTRLQHTLEVWGSKYFIGGRLQAHLGLDSGPVAAQTCESWGKWFKLSKSQWSCQSPWTAYVLDTIPYDRILGAASKRPRNGSPFWVLLVFQTVIDTISL